MAITLIGEARFDQLRKLLEPFCLCRECLPLGATEEPAPVRALHWGYLCLSAPRSAMALLTGAIEDESCSWRMFGFEVEVSGTRHLSLGRMPMKRCVRLMRPGGRLIPRNCPFPVAAPRGRRVVITRDS